MALGGCGAGAWASLSAADEVGVGEDNPTAAAEATGATSSTEPLQEVPGLLSWPEVAARDGDAPPVMIAGRLLTVSVSAVSAAMLPGRTQTHHPCPLFSGQDQTDPHNNCRSILVSLLCSPSFFYFYFIFFFYFYFCFFVHWGGKVCAVRDRSSTRVGRAANSDTTHSHRNTHDGHTTHTHSGRGLTLTPTGRPANEWADCCPGGHGAGTRWRPLDREGWSRPVGRATCCVELYRAAVGCTVGSGWRSALPLRWLLVS